MRGRYPQLVGASDDLAEQVVDDGVEGPVMPTVHPALMSSRICPAAVNVFPVPGGPWIGR